MDKLTKLSLALDASRTHTDQCGVCSSAKAHGRNDWRCLNGLRLSQAVDRAARAAGRES